MSQRKMVVCPQCAGVPDCDESGRAYTCYLCCNTGMVRQDIAHAIERACAWSRYCATEAAIRKRAELGVPDGWGYYIDEYEGPVFVPPPAAAPTAASKDEWEDIPF